MLTTNRKSMIHTQKMKRQKNFSQLKEQEKILEKVNNETEKNNLPDEEFKTLVIKMLTELGKRIALNSKHFNKEIQNIKSKLQI